MRPFKKEVNLKQLIPSWLLNEFQHDTYGISTFCVNCESFVPIAYSHLKDGHIVLKKDTFQGNKYAHLNLTQPSEEE